MEYLSEGVQAVTGYKPEDLIGNKKLAYNDIIRQEFRESLWEKWEEVLSQRESFEGEYPIMDAQGNTRWVWERGKGIFTEDGRLLRLEGFITDISDRKKAEEEIFKLS